MSTDWQSTVAREDIEVVIVCTTHNLLPQIAQAAASHGKHVLIEKPGARRASELNAVRQAANRTGALVRVGFNHRYHRAFVKAREIFESGVLEDLLFVRARYGHGGRPGYETEWRADAAISGGGEAIDQGMHLIDLARWFLGGLKFTGGQSRTLTSGTCPWKTMRFFLLETAARQVAFLHLSGWTEWKHIFSFEIFGRMGKLRYPRPGRQLRDRITPAAIIKMTPEMGPPPTTIYEYPMSDRFLGA